MSLVTLDIINNPAPLIFILNAKSDGKVMGVANQLSAALRMLYLADETALLTVNYLGVGGSARVTRPCINDTYDCFIGHFYFEHTDHLTYKRNLTNEIQVIEDSETYLTEEDLTAIQHELDRMETDHQHQKINRYHAKAHQVMDEVITKHFNHLAGSLAEMSVKIRRCNQDYDLGLEYDLIIDTNQQYQQANQGLNVMTIEDNVALIQRMTLRLDQVDEEIIAMNEMLKSLKDEAGGANVTDIDELDELDELDDGDLSWWDGLDPSAWATEGTHRHRSPTPDNPAYQLNKRVKDPNVNKIVTFDLDKTQIYSY